MDGVGVTNAGVLSITTIWENIEYGRDLIFELGNKVPKTGMNGRVGWFVVSFRELPENDIDRGKGGFAGS